MKAVIAMIVENLSRRPMRWQEMQERIRRMNANLNIIYLMKSAGYVVYSDGSWSLNRQMNQDQKNIFADVLSLYKKQQAAYYAKAKQKKPEKKSEPTPTPEAKPVLSLSVVLSKLSDEKLIEEVQKRGYIVFSA